MQILHDVSTLRDVPDTAVTLALELSAAMENISRDLKSILEKVDSLKSCIKLSVSRKIRHVFTDLWQVCLLQQQSLIL